MPASPPIPRIKLALAVVVSALVIALIVWALRNLASAPEAPRRQVSRVAILPDAPPPPPPPPPKEQKEEPKAEPKARPVPDNSPKPPAPANQPLKMEGAAGNGPSAFQAGTVTQDYKGGPVGGGAASAPAVADRAAERLYAGSVRQLLRDEIERQLPDDAGEITTQFALWVASDGRIARWELESGHPKDALVHTALERGASQLRLPPPQAVPQPLRFRLTLRAAG